VEENRTEPKSLFCSEFTHVLLVIIIQVEKNKINETKSVFLSPNKMYVNSNLNKNQIRIHWNRMKMRRIE
jgi:hypothetical protein